MKTILLILLLAATGARAESENRFRETLRDRYECEDSRATSVPDDGSGLARILKYRLCVDKRFSAIGRDLLRRSFDGFITRIAKRPVYQCYREATRRLATPGARNETHGGFLRKYLVSTLGGSALSLASDLPYVFLSPRLSDAAPWGRFVERYEFFDDKTFSPYRPLVGRSVAFAVDSMVLGAPDLPFGGDASFWASALGMAMLDSLGVTSDPLSPAGSPLHEIGKCLLWEGKVPEEFHSGRESR